MMETVNLLDFLNMVSDLYTLDYIGWDDDLLDFLDLMLADEQFTQKIDLGLIFLRQETMEQFTIVDGLGRILSLSLLLHAVCECYKKTSPRNTEAIKTIRAKYLMAHKNTPKLRLPEKHAEIYSKIINGEKLSGHEKDTPMFILLHNFWSKIKEEKIQAASIFRMLKKITVTLVYTGDVSIRDLYYKLNSSKNINQVLLIKDYLKEMKLEKTWSEVSEIFDNKDSDILLFLRDFFIPKFNYKKFDNDRIYESFVNYFETMLQYVKPDVIMSKFKKAAGLYSDILNVKFKNTEIRDIFIEIKRHSGEDTFAYILEIYNDYVDKNMAEEIFIEILKTIDDYLKNRNISENNMEFNELIQYLNAFITCK